MQRQGRVQYINTLKENSTLSEIKLYHITLSVIKLYHSTLKETLVTSLKEIEGYYYILSRTKAKE